MTDQADSRDQQSDQLSQEARHPLGANRRDPVRARDALTDVERVYVGIPDALTSEELVRLQALIQSCLVTDKYTFEKDDEKEEKLTRAIINRAAVFEDYLRDGVEKTHPSTRPADG